MSVYNAFLAASVATATGDASLLTTTLADMAQRGVAPNAATLNAHAYLALRQANWQLAEVRSRWVA